MAQSSDEPGLIRVIPPFGADLDPLVAALESLGVIGHSSADEPAERATPILLVDLRGAGPDRTADLAPPNQLSVIAIVRPPAEAIIASLAENLLLVVEPQGSMDLMAAGIAAVASRVSELESAFLESENILEIHQEVIRAAGETIRLKEEVEERARELRTAQEQVERTRRLTALGTLGAGLAHELNNPMTTVLGLSQVVQSMLPAESEECELLTDVVGQAKRIVGLLREFRRVLDEEQSIGTRPFDVGEPLRAAVELYAVELSERNIQTTTTVADPLPWVAGNSTEIQEAICHLIKNAGQALPEGGELGVRVHCVEEEAVFISVSDNGPGIPQDLRERVFDPFFTTHSANKQTGLGLSVTHRIVARHHGSITIEDTPGGGATFTIMLPAVPKKAHLY